MRDLVTDAGAGNRTKEGEAVLAEALKRKEQIEAELAVADAAGIPLGEKYIPRTEPRRGGAAAGEFRTQAGAIEAPVEPAQSEPTYNEEELRQLKAAGLQLSAEAEEYLRVRDQFREAQADAEEARRRDVLVRASKAASKMEKITQDALDAEEARVEARTKYAGAREEWDAIQREARALGILPDIPVVPSVAERETRLSRPDHDRVHKILRAQVPSWR